MSAAASTGLTLCSCSWPVYVSQGALISFMRGNLQPTALCQTLSLTCLHPGICRNLKSIVVQIGIADYFKEPSSPEAQKLFEDMVTKLQVRGGLCGSKRPLGWGW